MKQIYLDITYENYHEFETTYVVFNDNEKSFEIPKSQIKNVQRNLFKPLEITLTVEAARFHKINGKLVYGNQI